MRVNRHLVAQKIAAYLHHEISLDTLVDWAENAMMEGDFDDEQFAEIRATLARLGLADVRSFGLAWEDCEQLLKELGYTAHVEIAAA